ncbi:MAG: hypothetical protein MN733_37185 [Nitrososphaera sp.]|nr:hypothetical protein [Nitrososphaera sp.]
MKSLALFGLFILAGCISAPAQGLPKAVGDKYAELGSKYAAGLGAILNNCTKNGQPAYIVVGSGGFSGETFIYDGGGKLVQQFEWDDMVEPGETLPPFDSEQYKCTVLNESKK